jgi:pimeloyl-ACP methyl ester carboxylesterase
MDRTIAAVVHTGRHETAYRRAGAGLPVVLLTGAREAELGDWLFGQLARRFRTIAPVLPPGMDPGVGARAGGGPDLDEWLRGVIDGLGLERPALVGGPAWGFHLLRFQAVDPHRVRRLALVQPVVSGAAPPLLELPDDAGSGAPLPALVVGLPATGDREGRRAALERLVRFLTGAF